jgi:predicted Zn-dependent peptidase
MLFKGSATRSRQQMEFEVEERGALLTAYTSREHGFYQLQSHVSGSPYPNGGAVVNWAVDFLSDLVLWPLLDPEAFEQERYTIWREAEEVANDAHETLLDCLHAAVFPGDGYGRVILGDRVSLAHLSRSALQNYHQSHFVPSAMVLCAAGNVDHAALVDAASKVSLRSPSPAVPAQPKPASAPPSNFTNFRPTTAHLSWRKRDPRASGPQVHIAVALEGAGWAAVDLPALLVAQELLGAWDDSQTVPSMASTSAPVLAAFLGRSQHAVKQIQPFHAVYGPQSLFGSRVSASLNHDRFDAEVLAQEYIQALRAVFCSPTAHTALAAAVPAAAARLATQLAAPASASELNEFSAQHFLANRDADGPRKLAAAVASVTSSDVVRAISSRLDAGCIAVVSISETLGTASWKASVGEPEILAAISEIAGHGTLS